jgi:hypothetical protein
LIKADKCHEGKDGLIGCESENEMINVGINQDSRRLLSGFNNSLG